MLLFINLSDRFNHIFPHFRNIFKLNFQFFIHKIILFDHFNNLKCCLRGEVKCKNKSERRGSLIIIILNTYHNILNKIDALLFLYLVVNPKCMQLS